MSRSPPYRLPITCHRLPPPVGRLPTACGEPSTDSLSAACQSHAYRLRAAHGPPVDRCATGPYFRRPPGVGASLTADPLSSRLAPLGPVGSLPAGPRSQRGERSRPTGSREETPAPHFRDAMAARTCMIMWSLCQCGVQSRLCGAKLVAKAEKVVTAPVSVADVPGGSADCRES